MAERTRSSEAAGDQPSDEAVQATSDQYAGADPRAVASEQGTTARNPVELGTDVDQLPPVPGAGQFMTPDQATEEPSPDPLRAEGDQQQKKG